MAEVTINPITGRQIRVGGATYRQIGGATYRILAIFEKVTEISSNYTTALIKDKDQEFAKYLSKTLSVDEIDRWEQNPNDPTILDEIAHDGFDFYNYMYIGNDGYEHVGNVVCDF